jgi:iron donor protein CyaY
VLDITLPSGAQYVINRHAPSQQIWVSSPVSSASHFALKSSGKWLNRQELELRSMLQDELKTYVSLNFD